MTTDKGIFIKNVYYMLSYAFRILKRDDYKCVGKEKFENIHDLFAEILCRAVSEQLKQGLYCEYTPMHEDLSVIRGKLNMRDTIHLQMQRKQKVSCEYDEFSPDNMYNRIIKTTMLYLLRAENTDKVRKQKLKSLLAFFSDINTTEPQSIQWHRLNFCRTNRNYEMLLNICCFVLDGMLQTTENGAYKLLSFSDEHMERLYEKFILEYYRYHHPELHARDMEIEWNLTEPANQTQLMFLPKMKTDITLKNKKGDKTLIIDAKYYGRILSEHFDKKLLSSANLYQVYTYVKNYAAKNTGNVSGLLLYAKTEEDMLPAYEPFIIGGNSIGADVLDLNCDFSQIAQKLESIVQRYFGV